MSTEESFQLPDFTSLPSYYPVNLSLSLNADLKQSQLIQSVDAKIQKLKKSTESYIKFLLSSHEVLRTQPCNEYLQKQAKLYSQLMEAKFKLQQLQLALKLGHRVFVTNRHNEEDLSLANYFVYKDVVKENFGDSMISDIDRVVENSEHIASVLATDLWLQYMKNAVFVMQHPEDQLPDDLKDEELAVAGGKVSLKDPLSLNYFVDPVQSKACGHVYEKEHIIRLFETDVINCPVTGCDGRVLRSDLVDDELMSLRVKAFLADESLREHKAIRI